MKSIKKFKLKKLILLVILLVVGYIVFSYVSNINKNEICLDCEKWKKSHENKKFCTMVVWNCPTCYEERYCG